MLCTRGQLPRQINYTLATRNFALLLFAITYGSLSLAQHRVPLTLAEAEDLALSGEPGQQALLARAEALDHESVAAGALPDPTLRVGLANYPLESGGFTTEGMTQAQLGIRQTFPSGGVRSANTRRFQHSALAMRQGAAGREQDVLTAVRRAWLEVFFWERARAIVEESRPLFADMVRIARSLYSLGRRDQQDLLLAELELSRIEDRLLDIDRRHAQAIASLSEWTGDASGRPTGGSLPNWAEVPDLDSLKASIAAHPAVAAADARIAATRAGVDVAEAAFKPGWALDVGYGHRNGLLPGGAPRSDFLSVSVTIDLPVFRKNRQDRKLSAALSERRAANAAKAQVIRELESTLVTEHARWSDLSRRIELYESRILGQSGSHAAATLTAYQSDAGDFADVMRGHINDLNIRVEYLRLQVDRAQGYAVLANLGGLTQ